MSEQDATEYDADGFTDGLSDSEYENLVDDDSADVDVDDPGDGDDSDDLYADLGNTDADQFDLGAGVEDEPNVIEPITDAQLLADEKIRAKNRRDPSRIVDNLNEEVGPQIAAARWDQYHEAVRQENVDATNPESAAENEARAVANAAEWLRAQDESNDAGFISGEGSEHDADDAKRRFANAKDRWRDWCADPNN